MMHFAKASAVVDHREMNISSWQRWYIKLFQNASALYWGYLFFNHAFVLINSISKQNNCKYIEMLGN